MARKKSLKEILHADDEPGATLFVLFIPSKTKDGKALPKGEEQELWAAAAGDCLSELFGGSTEMPPAKGKWRNDESGETITEEVILVHSYASTRDASNEQKLHELAVFLHRMGKKTNQGEVALVIDNVFYKIRRFVLA